MALASVRFLCQGLSTLPKCSTRSKGSAPSLQLQCQLNSVRPYISLSALWATTITMPSTVYWTELLIISLESGTRTSVSFTVTGELSANVELRSPAYLMSVLDMASSHSATKMRESESFCLGNNHVTFWQWLTKEIPREQKRDKLLTVSMGKSWDQSLCISYTPKNHMFFISQKTKDPTEGPGYLNPTCMEAVYTFRKPPLGN